MNFVSHDTPLLSAAQCYSTKDIVTPLKDKRKKWIVPFNPTLLERCPSRDKKQG
jgi:hypothetical protein